MKRRRTILVRIIEKLVADLTSADFDRSQNIGRQIRD
jgi:hypothetical protein